jgi:hypothetical protein
LGAKSTYPDASISLRIAAAARVPITGRDHLPRLLIRNVVKAIGEIDGALLDAIDACLHATDLQRDKIRYLNDTLRLGGSIWTIGEAGRALVRRVDATATAAKAAATSPNDEASRQLAEAWAKVYGRNPNASDAWDHAIKAVEAVLIPIVVPNQHQPQLGHVLGQLKNQGQQYDLVLQPQQGLSPVETLLGMLQLMWPNPDRHSGSQHREPSIKEAEAVVLLAVTIVQWARAGIISKRA